MEGLLLGVLAVGIVAVSPFVPGLRTIARKALVASMAAGASTIKVAAVASEQWKDLVAEAQAERDAQEQATGASPAAIEAETIRVPLPQ